MKLRFVRCLCLVCVLCLMLCSCAARLEQLGTIVESFAEQAGLFHESPSQSPDVLTRGSGLAAGQATAKLDDDPEHTTLDSSTAPVSQSFGTMFDGQDLTDEFYFYRNSITEQQQNAYDIIRAGLLRGDTIIDMTVPVSTDEVFDLYQMVLFDSPEIFWVETTMCYNYNLLDLVTSIEPEYNDLVYDIAGSTAKMENAVHDALSHMWEMDSDIQRVKFAHDYLTHKNDYVLDADYNQCTYSALVTGETVCAGYAHSFQYMMQKMGIPCAYVVGSSGEDHAWNVLLLDGEYYSMDVTWDDPVGAGPDDYFYDYFNITDDQMSENHTRSAISDCIPWANGTTYSYENIFGGYENDYDEYDNTEDSTDEYDWWNALDSSWTKDDWTYDDGLWVIWDDETQSYYVYDEDTDMYACIDGDTEEVYIMDPYTYEWVLLED